MKKIGMLFFLLIFMFTITACDCGDGGDCSTGASADTIVINGSVVLSPVDGAEVKLFRYSEKGSEIEIIAANAPVITSSSGAYECQVNYQDVKDINTPLVLRSTGGTMGGQPAPALEALIPDPKESASAAGNVTRHLSAASSVAAQILKDTVAATGSAPETKSAEECIAKVENALDVDLTQDPSDASQAVAKENKWICQDLDLSDKPENNSIVRDYIEYVAVNLMNSSSDMLESGNSLVEDPEKDINETLSEALGITWPPLFYRIRLNSTRTNIRANDFDSVKVYISMHGGWGQLVRYTPGNVELELISGEARLSDTEVKLKNGRGKVLLASGVPGQVVLLAKYKQFNGKVVTQTIALNFFGGTATNNTPPVADAGMEQTVDTGSVVALDGSASSDSDGDPLTYAWTISEAPQGSTAALSDATAVAPTFTADMDGTYVIQLVVNDGAADSDPSVVTITAVGTANSAPTADAGTDQQVTLGTMVTLDGSASNDPDGDALIYSWTMVDMPQGSTATLSDPASDIVTFTPDVIGDYAVQLIVNDGMEDSTPAMVIVTAN